MGLIQTIENAVNKEKEEVTPQNAEAVKVEQPVPAEEVKVAAPEPEVVTPSTNACNSCRGSGLIGDPTVSGNKVCEQCLGKGVN